MLIERFVCEFNRSKIPVGLCGCMCGGGGLSLEGTVAGTGFLDQARLVEAHPGPTAQSLA